MMKTKQKESRSRKLPVKQSQILIPKAASDLVLIKDDFQQVLWSYLFGIKNADKLTDIQKLLFLKTAQSQNLNPLKREIYAIPFEVTEWDPVKREKRGTGVYDLAIVTGYEVYLKRAQRDPLYHNYKVWLEDFEVDQVNYKGEFVTDDKGRRIKKRELVAKIEVYRKGKPPFPHEVYMSEYFKGNAMWKYGDGKPRTMLKKVVIAQAHRLLYTQETDGLPYIYEEHPELLKQIFASPESELKKEINLEPIQLPDIESKELDKKITELVGLLGWKPKAFKDFTLGLFPKVSKYAALTVEQRLTLEKKLNEQIDINNAKAQ